MTIAVAHFADGLGNLLFNEVVSGAIFRTKPLLSYDQPLTAQEESAIGR